MKRIFCIIFACIALVGCTNDTVKHIEAENIEVEQVLTYSNSFVSFEYPSSWEISKGEPWGGKFLNLETKSNGPIMFVFNSHTFEFVESWLAIDPTGPNSSTAEHTTYAGYPALEYWNGGQRYLVKIDNNYVQISPDIELSSKNLKLLNLLLDSISFL